ncbi:hypothetical protein J5J10_07885 [Ciceribacter sp. L1K23]|uniref:hypothetical protein n=1 Tax=Ciceribacter sp. L1K23 TaxID=2820276 RepID=UPI001B814D13|nr:hypothetical protein [Ciceribacter sp. L1K23]MBR0555599.1 hypothetical protein [Ciceribacter sp. L1K23]
MTVSETKMRNSGRNFTIEIKGSRAASLKRKQTSLWGEIDLGHLMEKAEQDMPVDARDSDDGVARPAAD